MTEGEHRCIYFTFVSYFPHIYFTLVSHFPHIYFRFVLHFPHIYFTLTIQASYISQTSLQSTPAFLAVCGLLGNFYVQWFAIVFRMGPHWSYRCKKYTQKYLLPNHVAADQTYISVMRDLYNNVHCHYATSSPH